MRKIMFLPAIVASALALGYAGVVTQVNADGPAAPPTTIPGLDELGALGLTPEQTQCLVENSSNLDMNDMTAVMELMTTCGIDPMDLLGAADASDEVAVAETSPTDDTSASGERDAATVAAVLDLLGVDATSLQCIRDGLSTAVADDDNAALTVLQGCGLTLSELLAGLVSVNDVAAVGDLPTTAVEAPGTTATATATGSSSGIVEQLQQMLLDQGIDLTDEQAGCLLENVSGLDMSDMNATLAVFESCGISLTDITG